MNPRPPRIWRGLIRWLVPAGERSFVLSELDEAFEATARERGVAAARRWYRSQVLRSLLPLIGNGVTESLRGLRGGELRRALRLLLRRPMYAFGVAGTLGLGFGSAIVLGGIAWRVWLQPLSLPDSERLVRVYELGQPDQMGERDRGWLSPPLLRELTGSEWSHFVGFGAVMAGMPEWIVEGEIRQLDGSSVTPGFFDLLGIRALHGRAEWRGRAGAEIPEAILSEAFWRQHFGADPGVVGSEIDLGGTAHTIVGVVSPPARYPRPVDIFTPLVFEERQLGPGMRGARYLEVVARVQPESTIDAAALEFSGFIERLGSAWPSHLGWSGEVVSLRNDLTGPFRDVLRLLLGAGLAFLTLAAVNVAGLSAARALSQRRDTAVRIALGASGARRSWSALVEGGLLGLVGGFGALIAAELLLSSAGAWLPGDLPRASELGLSTSEMVGWIALSALCGGVIVTLGTRLVPTGVLQRLAVRSTRGMAGGRALVAGQFALTTLLLGSGALVFERSIELADHDLGFDAARVHSGFVSLPRTTNEDWEARRASWFAVISALEEQGLGAAISTNPPMSGSNSNYPYHRPGDEDVSFGQYSIVSSGYFDVLRIPLMSGRTFQPGEAREVTIISQALADAHFPNEDPIGQTLSIIEVPHEIVGVVGSTAHFGPDVPEPPAIYVPYTSINWDFAHVLARGEEGGRAGARISDAVERVVPGATAQAVAPYETKLSSWFRPLRIQLAIVGALGMIGSLLAALGLYSIIAFQVRGQLMELGIRMALGATRGRIVTGVLNRGVATALGGFALGLGAWWLGREQIGGAIGSTGVGVSVLSLMFTTLAVVGLALLASSLPAVRAARASPLESLQSE